MKKIRVGTRTSALAVRQTELVMEKMKSRNQEVSFELISQKTKGDRLLDVPLTEFGGKGAFTTEFEEAILTGRMDIAVHSAKDMPMELAEGLDIWMVLEREDARDVLISRRGEEPATGLAEGKKKIIGTGSPRRRIQIEGLMNAECSLLRGNVPTRIEKLRQGRYDGIILAAAGLKRLGLDQEEDLCYRYLSFDEMIPAGGQGIIAVEGRGEDERRSLFKKCSDHNAELELETERYILKRLGATCHEPVGVFAKIERSGSGQMGSNQETITIRLLLERDGKPCRGSVTGSAKERLKLAERLLKEVAKI